MLSRVLIINSVDVPPPLSVTHARAGTRGSHRHRGSGGALLSVLDRLDEGGLSRLYLRYRHRGTMNRDGVFHAFWVLQFRVRGVERGSFGSLGLHRG